MSDSYTIISVDTPVFVSALGLPDVYTEASQQFFSSLSLQQPLLLSVVAVAETIVVLSRQNPLSGRKSIDYLFQFRTISLHEDLVRQSVKFLSRSTLKSSDFYIATTCALNSATLITWDTQLLSKANTICNAITPTQFITKL